MTENTSGADTSYEQALKSTGIVGGAQFLTILITVVKTKIVALLLGPAGVGVLGLLQGIVDMIRNATGLGIHFSAVKDVAAANASRDGQRIGRTIRILRRWVWGTGLLGMTVAIALSIPLRSVLVRECGTCRADRSGFGRSAADQFARGAARPAARPAHDRQDGEGEAAEP